MCVDCVLASPRIAQVDPDDGPPPEVVLSHLRPSRCSCGKDAQMWDLGPWMRDHWQRHAKIRGSGSKCGMCLAYGRLDWYSAGPQDRRACATHWMRFRIRCLRVVLVSIKIKPSYKFN
jgi:hypothetical protein